MTFSATLDKTLRLYRAHFVSLLKIAAVALVAAVPAAFETAPLKERGAPIGGWGVYALLMFIWTVIAWPLQYGALAKSSLAVLAGTPISFGSAYRAALGRFGSLLWAGFLVMLATIPASLLLVIPGIYVVLGYSLGTFAIMEEGLGGFDGLKRSWHLARGRRWRIFGLLFVWLLLQLVLGYALSAVFKLVGLEVIGPTLAQQLASILIVPCYGLSLALTFSAARAEREGHDLELEARRLAEGAAGASGAPA